MSWLTNWFRQDATQVFIKLIVKAMKLWIGSMADALWIIIQEEVKNIELQTGLSGHEKGMAVLSNVKKRLGSTKVRTMYLKLLIEAAVIVMREAKS